MQKYLQNYKEPSYKEIDASYKEPSYKEPSYKEIDASYKEPSYKEPSYKEIDASYKEPSYKEIDASYKEIYASYKEPSYMDSSYKDAPKPDLLYRRAEADGYYGYAARGQPKYSAESSYKPGTRKVSHPMEVTGYKGYKDVFVSKDVITPIESKTMDLIVVDSYKTSRSEDACVDYKYHVLSAIELLDVNNETCKDQYRDLRTGVADRTLFDYCLESIFVKDSGLYQGRDQQYFYSFTRLRHNGVADLLEILGSIIHGFEIPLKEEHKTFSTSLLFIYRKYFYFMYRLKV
ncbi:uncharacterized protein LOC111714552 isoform X2 [Eurytemora carolleeae]|uniref:uncharacterized protein LOC111714552 isoform X2 n=1 Tax=Eurytemora carolleeae TaxID=1294199 RepID=UPI000C7788E0|nr:uncharacterized protein LOC111714552 isoform X2 [Eurytemora carolleeae]|eukprot:XP_023345453.1 uncharacterized protein LOC111714552 isoform X2 [Eurytemora affinis]